MTRNMVADGKDRAKGIRLLNALSEKLLPEPSGI